MDQLDSSTMTDTNSKIAVSMVALIQRFIGTQPDALKQMRSQVQSELESARGMMERAEAQLAAIEQLEALIDAENASGPAVGATVPAITPLGPPPLKQAILLVLDEDPDRVWDRELLLTELNRRGWGPGGSNPRNTLTSRLRDLEKEHKLHRQGRHGFTSLQNEGALAV